MKILLLNPPASGFFVREGRCMNRLEAYGSLWPPLGLMYLSSILKEAGHEVLLMDAMASGFSLEAVSEFSPALAVINTSTPTIKNDIEAAGTIKEKTGALTALFGVHVTGTHLDLVRDNPSIDFAIRGEPDYTVRELANCLERGGDVSGVFGITFRQGSRIVANGEMPPVKNLDELPLPDRDAVDNSRYTLPFTKRPFAMVLTSRGCPYDCAFCTVRLYTGTAFRSRSPSKIADEVKLVAEKYGIRDFMFYADEFTLDNKKTMELCSLLEPLKIRWFTNSRADTVNQELLDAMARSGCWLLSFGIESASQKILDNACKKLNVEKVKTAITFANLSGIKTIGHFVFGLPGETAETARETINFAKKVKLDYAQFYIAVPYPGTAFYEYCKKNGLIAERDWSKYEINNAVIRTESLAPEQLVELKKTATREFYFRPGYVLRLISDAKSFEELKNIVMQGMQYLRSWSMSGLKH